MKSLSLLVLFGIAGLATAADFKPRKVVRPFEPIRNPEIAPAAEAGEWVMGKELVLGVVVAGEARAYPINQLTSPTREIINDTLGDRSIAATW